MINVQIVPVTQELIEDMLPNVREADRLEFLAINGWSARRVLESGVKTSTVSAAGLVNGRVVTIFGVAPKSMIGGSGIPWLVATDELEKYQFTFLRRCRKAVNEMLSVYPYLENYVDERNHVAKSWLHWLGFHLDDALPYGNDGLNFHRFYMEKNNV